MFTTICTTLFFIALAYFAWRKGTKVFKVISFLLILLSIFTFVVLHKAERQIYELADKPIGERRGTILQTSFLIMNGTPEGDALIVKVEQLAKDDGIFSNRDYDQIANMLPANVIKEVNAHYPHAEQEENALIEITGAKK